MLACLPASGDPTVRLLPRTQMNTGLQKWETTQKMRSASYPTPAELDAYAKKIANNPLTIQIFPNSVKVPQRKHIRRTVNGLDTSSSAQRHSPYPSQVSASGGLLAVLCAPGKGLIKQSDGSRSRPQLKPVMNPQAGPYAAQSTLNLPHPAAHLPGPPQPPGQKQGYVHPAALQQPSLTHHMAHPQALQRQQSLPPGQPGGVGPQHLSHLQASGPPTMPGSLQPPPQGQYGPRKLPDADAPPNVTVSTSTIPLSMAGGPHQSRPADLSNIVLQINQLCQARAGRGATSVCEGQIANPSPISRNLLINASSRVSSHPPGGGGASSCLMAPHPDKALAQTPPLLSQPGPPLLSQPGAPLLSQPGPPLLSQPGAAAFHVDGEKLHHLHHQKQQLQLLQQQRSWAQHQLAHMQQPPEGAHPCKNPRMEHPAACAFPSRNLSYPHKLPNAPQGFPLKHTAEKPPPGSPLNCQLASMPYANGHYLHPPWSGPQDLPVVFQGGQAAASTNRLPGAKYRPGKEAPARSKLPQSVDFLGGDFQMPGFQEQNMDVMEKMHRAAVGQIQETSSSGGVHGHHHGYR